MKIMLPRIGKVLIYSGIALAVAVVIYGMAIAERSTDAQGEVLKLGKMSQILSLAPISLVIAGIIVSMIGDRQRRNP